jgi:hypothetical protein
LEFIFDSLNETINTLFVGFFTVLMWMAAWSPAERFLYGLRPYMLEMKIFRSLREVDVTIKEE